MDEIRPKLIECFQTVFPTLSVAEIPNVSQSSWALWDSVAAITLVNVVEEEFGIEMDLEQVGDLDSFARIHEYLEKAMQELR